MTKMVMDMMFRYMVEPIVMTLIPLLSSVDDTDCDGINNADDGDLMAMETATTILPPLMMQTVMGLNG